jgi:hypothetical protein
MEVALAMTPSHQFDHQQDGDWGRGAVACSGLRATGTWSASMAASPTIISKANHTYSSWDKPVLGAKKDELQVDGL